MATRARLAGIDVRYRQTLPFKRIRLIRLDIGLADQAEFFPTHRNNVHFGGAIRMGPIAHPRLQSVPPKPTCHQGQEKFRHRVGLES